MKRERKGRRKGQRGRKAKRKGETGRSRIKDSGGMVFTNQPPRKKGKDGRAG